MRYFYGIRRPYHPGSYCATKGLVGCVADPTGKYSAILVYDRQINEMEAHDEGVEEIRWEKVPEKPQYMYGTNREDDMTEEIDAIGDCIGHGIGYPYFGYRQVFYFSKELSDEEMRSHGLMPFYVRMEDVRQRVNEMKLAANRYLYTTKPPKGKKTDERSWDFHAGMYYAADYIQSAMMERFPDCDNYEYWL